MSVSRPSSTSAVPADPPSLILLERPPGSPPPSSARLVLDGKDSFLLGSAEAADLRLFGRDFEPIHARILVTGPTVELLVNAERPVIYVDDQEVAVRPRLALELVDGQRFRTGGYHFQLIQPDPRRTAPRLKSLREWRDSETAEALPARLTVEEVERQRLLCGTVARDPDRLPAERVLDWYAVLGALGGCYGSVDLPLALPYVMDLGALVAFDQPLFFRADLGSSAIDRDGIGFRYAKEYVAGHLAQLAYWSEPRLAREQYARAAGLPERQTAMVGWFLDKVLRWVARVWVESDRARPSAPADGSGLPVREPGARWFTQPLSIRGFLIALSQAVASPMSRSPILTGVERLHLVVSARVPSDFDGQALSLINACLNSRDLDDRRLTIEPSYLEPRGLKRPANRSGDQAQLRGVSLTSSFEKLPRVLSQDLALLMLESGPRLFLGKFTHNGAQVLDLQDLDKEIRRRRFFLCFIVDDSLQARGRGFGGREVQLSPGDHARRLVFEFLRDLVALPLTSDVTVDLHVCREQGGAGGVAHRLELDELRLRLGRSRIEDMIELERMMPGFFSAHWVARSGPAPSGVLIRDAILRDDHDVILGVYLEAEGRGTRLLPPNLPPPRSSLRSHDAFRLVRLGQSASHSRTFRVNDLRRLATPVGGELVDDERLRAGLLEDLTGWRPGRPPTTRRQGAPE